MAFRKITIAVVFACCIAQSSTAAMAAWYDGSHVGMQDKFCNWLAELWVCGVDGCD